MSKIRKRVGKEEREMKERRKMVGIKMVFDKEFVIYYFFIF